MLEVSERVANLLENSTKFEIFGQVLLDIEVNGYFDYEIDFPESVEPTMFPEDHVFRSRRPLGGLPKLITPFGRFNSTDIDDLCYTKDRNWYRLPSKDSNYKYYRTKQLSALEAPFDFQEPLEFVVDYNDLIRLNKLVVGFEYATCLPESVEIFFYNNDEWVSAGSYSVPEDGLVVISYDGSWQERDLYSYDFTTTERIKLVISAMQEPGGAVEIIQVSPRISVDITDRIISLSSSKESQEESLVSPVGTSSSNSASFNISNTDGFFDNQNEESALYQLIDVNAKFTVKDLVGGDDEDFETVPTTVVFANSWNFQPEGTVTVDASDQSKFLQSRSIENSFYVDKDIRFVIADILERAEITDYKLCFAESDLEQPTPYFFFEDEQTVWEALQQIALAEQSFYYFDETGRFVWISRDYWWESEEVDFEILSRSNGEKLPNLESYSIEYTNVVNKVTVTYTPTSLLKQGNKFVNNFLWEQNEPLVLTASPLLSEIDEDSEFFLIRPEDFIFFPDEGIVNIDAEYIKYSKKPRDLSLGAGQIENTINEFINEVDFAVVNASNLENVDISDVKIVYIQKIVWPDTSIGLREPFRQYSRILVEGFFIILSVPDGQGGEKLLQYNASLTKKPFLAAVLTSDELEDYSYWSIVDDGEGLQLEFTEASTIFSPPNAMFIEERGVFNSKPTGHSFGAGEDGFTFTYNNTPPEIVTESPRIVYDVVEDSNLKLRINTISPDLIHHYSPNRPGKYDVYGAQFVFPLFFEQDDIGYDGQGIAGIFINKNGVDSGYYIEFTNSAYSRLTLSNKREVMIWKFDESGRKLIISGYLPEDLFLLSLEELISVAGKPTDIFPGIPQKVAIFVEDIEEAVFDGEDGEDPPTILEGIRIIVSVNGRRVLGVDDFDFEGNTIYREGDWGVFARSNTGVDFEYIYAIDRLGDTTPLDKAIFAIRDQITGGFIDNTLEYFLDEQNELRNEFVFEDFGGFARQIVEIDVNHEIVPSISSQIFASNESKIYFVYRNLDQFSSKFAIGNRTRDFIVVSGDDPFTGTNMVLSVFGVPLNRSESEDIKKINERSVWRRGEEEIIVESPWIQTKEKAQRISDWTVQRWSTPAEFLEVQVVVDPRIELGDLVTIDIPENSITPETHKFHVTAVQKTVGESPSMSLRLRRAHF